jgi:hypothetical protein
MISEVAVLVNALGLIHASIVRRLPEPKLTVGSLTKALVPLKLTQVATVPTGTDKRAAAINNLPINARHRTPVSYRGKAK